MMEPFFPLRFGEVAREKRLFSVWRVIVSIPGGCTAKRLAIEDKTKRYTPLLYIKMYL